MSILLQISDPHFGTEQPPVVAALRALVERVEPALVVLSGDITQRARPAQFEAARRFAATLRAGHVLATPGNHDIPLFNLWARLLRPYANFARAFGRELEPEFESDALLVLCVKTTRRLRHKDGVVSAAQVARVAARLRAAKRTQLRVVVTHQPVQVARAQDVANLLRGHEAAVRAWSAAGADILMGGHIHLPYVQSVSARFPELRQSLWVVQAGTALSTRVREGVPNSVNLVHYPADSPLSCRVERWDYDGVSGCFAQHSGQTLRLERS
jgi:3',5'-cyclic AMP phosphodiesterase CpdA